MNATTSRRMFNAPGSSQCMPMAGPRRSTREYPGDPGRRLDENLPMPAAVFVIRPAEPRDVDAIVGLIGALAEFEKLAQLCKATPSALHTHLFGTDPVVEAIVATTPLDDHTPIGFALFFRNYSTFLTRPGLYLEDLFVQPEHRNVGLGKAMLRRLARIAVERDYGRFDWSVLDWNANAIGFYERLGATVMPDWRICRMTGDALLAFGSADDNGLPQR